MSRAERVVAVFGALGCLIGLSCGGDDDPAAEGGGSSSGQDIAKVAMALTGGVDFENGAVVAALLPDPSNETVQLDQGSTTLSLEPGGAEILPLDVTNPDASDTQVEAVLLQFEGADEHIEVTVDGSTDAMESFELDFTVAADICDALCNEVVRLKLMQAVRMTDGSVSEHLERLLELDCSSDGDADACEGAKPMTEPGGGTEQPDGGSGGGPDSATVAAAFASALVGANGGLCKCAGFSADPCDAIVQYEAITCIRMAIEAAAGDTDVASAVSALQATLLQATSSCGACDATACPATLLSDGLDSLPSALAADILDCAGGTLPPEPPAAM